jgi:hypothetical protein
MGRLRMPSPSGDPSTEARKVICHMAAIATPASGEPVLPRWTTSISGATVLATSSTETGATSLNSTKSGSPNSPSVVSARRTMPAVR